MDGIETLSADQVHRELLVESRPANATQITSPGVSIYRGLMVE